MKRVLLVRHAKSSWNSAAETDFDRPLNDRGHKDAPEMAKRLEKKGISIDALVSSNAVRALTTAEYFAKEFDIKKKQIILVPELYLAPPENFFKVISGLDDDLKTVAIFSHNPGITEFVNQLSDVHVDDMPTCAVFAISTEISQWSEFAKSRKQFLFFDYPKNALNSF